MFGKAPDTVPDGLSASEYHELGLWYEENRQLDLARQAYQRAIALDPDGEIGANCKRVLSTRIPRHQIPPEAIERLARAEVTLQFRPADSRRIAEKMVKELPDFEWPLRLLAELCLNEGDLEGCYGYCRAALKINPDYVRALAVMSRALAVEMNYEASTEFLERALDLTPRDVELRRFQRALELVIALDRAQAP